MTETKAVARVATEMVMDESLKEMMALGQVFAKSGFFADAREAAQCVTKMLAGRELGFSPIASMTNIYIVKGRLSMGATLIAARLRNCGYDYSIKKLDDKGCAIEFRRGETVLGVSSFTAEDATRAGLTAGDNYKKYPRNMYFSRAMSNGAKWYCADAFLGGAVYTPDEMPGDEPAVNELESAHTTVVEALVAQEASEQPQSTVVVEVGEDLELPKQPERKTLDTPIPTPITNANELLVAVNTETGGYFKHVKHMWNALLEDGWKMDGWANPRDTDAWRRMQHALVVHAQKRQAEKVEAEASHV